MTSNKNIIQSDDPKFSDDIAPIAKSQSAAKSNIYFGEFEKVFSAIEEAFPNQKEIKTYTFPTARQWLGPRFMAIWVFPLLAFRKLRSFLYSIYSILLE